MKNEIPIPEPLLFNPFKHFLPFIKDFISHSISNPVNTDPGYLVRDLKHLGTSVMDVYTGDLSQNEIFKEIMEFLASKDLDSKVAFGAWVGSYKNFKVELSDSSLWTMKFHDNESRFVHIFPARLSPRTFRVKANTLKSAILYMILVGKDYVSEHELNTARALAGLSPVKEVADAEAVTEMIEILRK